MNATILIEYPSSQEYIHSNEMEEGVLYYCYEPNIDDYARNILYLRCGITLLTLGASGNYLSWRSIKRDKEEDNLYFRVESGTKVKVQLEQR